MNIMMLVLNNFTNDARVHKEAATLASAGYQVTVVALWQPGLAQIEQKYGYRVIRIHLLSRRWKNHLLSPPIKYIEFAWRVWSLAGCEPVQVFHANDANTLISAWLAAKRHNAKIIYDVHELETGRNFGNSSFSRIYQHLWSFPEKLFIHKVQSVITVNASIANELIHLYNIHSPYVIMNCPDMVLLSPTDRLRNELHIPENQKIIIYQGRVTAGRGLESFFATIQQLKNTVGVVLGDGPNLESYRDRLRSCEWQRIYFIGMVPLVDLPSYTASADLGVVLIQDTCLSYRLSLPNKLFEYLHAGLPVICSNLPEMARIVQKYQVGELVNPEDPASIANGIHAILRDPTHYAQMKANALIAAKVFNWQNESKKLLEIYRNLTL